MNVCASRPDRREVIIIGFASIYFLLVVNSACYWIIPLCHLCYKVLEHILKKSTAITLAD